METESRVRFGEAAALALILMFVSTRAHASDDDVPPKPIGKPLKLSGTSTIELVRYADGRVIPRTRRVAFFTHDIFDTKKQTLVLREQIDLEAQAGGHDGWVRHNVELVATTVLPNGKREPRFTVHAIGEDASEYLNLYVVTSYGCCDQADGHSWFSFLTGKLVMHTAGAKEKSILAIGPSDSHVRDSRYIGVHTSNAVFAGDEYPQPPKGRPRHAVVTYASDAEAITQVLVTMPPENLEMDPVRKLEVRHASALDGDSTVRIELSDAVTFELPIHADNLDLAHARLPAGVTATILPPKTLPGR